VTWVYGRGVWGSRGIYWKTVDEQKVTVRHRRDGKGPNDGSYVCMKNGRDDGLLVSGGVGLSTLVFGFIGTGCGSK